MRLLLVSILSLWLVACGDDSKEKTEILRPVRYQSVTFVAGGQERTFSGVTQASLESSLSFKVGGTLRELAVVVGAKVKKGQVLARLNDRDFSIRVQEIEASLEKTRAEARNAQANYDRTRGLYENRNASLNELDAARAGAESARAAVRSIEKQLEYERLQLSYTTLMAPEDCVVADIKPRENENVSAGQPIFMVNCGQLVKVKVAIPEGMIASIKQGDVVSVRFDVLPTQVFAARVSEVGVSSSDLGTTYPVTVQLNAAIEKVRSGMAAEVIFKLNDIVNATPRTFVPAAAVNEDQQGRYVYVLEAHGDGTATVHRRTVTVGELTPSGLDIVQGLQEKELVVTAGISRIQDKQKVRLD